MRVCDAAVEILSETHNAAVMWGDVGLLHKIAHRAGMKSEGSKTERRVLAALTKQPGILIPGRTRIRGVAHGCFKGGERLVRIFRLPPPGGRGGE